MITSNIVPFGEWLPDRPDLANSATDILNAIPQANSYRQMNSLQSVSSALDSRALRAFVVKDSSQVVNNFAGDAGKLYKLSGITYSDVSKAGGYTATNWEFAKFGDRVIAVAPNTAPQYYDMGTSSLFADLPGSPPQSEHMAVIRDFIVFGNVIDSGTGYPQRVQWSGFNNSEIWGVDAGAQADFQDLFGNGGRIQRIVPGEYGVIFQESAIWRMDYAGPPTVFRFDEVERGRGTLAPNSVTWLGTNVFYWGNDGFYVFDGQMSQPIGSEKVDRYVVNNFDTSQAEKFYGGIDRRNNLVLWVYPTVGGALEMIIYNWMTQKWSRSDLQVELFTEYADAGYTLDELDTLFPNGIDLQSINVDSPLYRGGAIDIGAFNSSHQLANFTGAALDATLTTGEIVGPNGRRRYIQAARPLVEGMGTYQVALGQRATETASTAFGTAQSVNSLGECQFHNDVRFHRFKATLSGGFEHAMGVEVFGQDGGRI